MILGLDAAAGDARRQCGRVKDRGQIDAAWPSSAHRRGSIELVHAADHFIHVAEAELCHVLANLFGEKEEEVDDMLGLAGEAGAEDGILGGDSDRAGIEVAFAHHDAAHGNERGGGKAEFLGTEESGDDDVAAGLELAVGLHA